MDIKKILRMWLRKLVDSVADERPVVCVWCGNRENVKVPIRPLVTIVTCSECNRQILLIGLPDKPYGLNPKMLKDDVDLCRYDCHFAEPYGFVPMAGCPIHD